MIFNFLKYVKPIWYFNLQPKVDNGYFLHKNQLEQLGFYQEYDTRYISNEAQIRDLAWCAFQSGVINKNYQSGISVWKNTQLPIHDEYLFLFKNFNKLWVLYVLIIRILSLKNPYLEIKSFLKTKNTTRIDYEKSKYQYTDYATYQSNLIAEQPLVSVIIPTLNRYQYLKDVLKDLENQTYKNFEVIIVDQSDGYKEDFYKGWKLDLKHWYQKEKALWKARNEAIKVSQGNYILLYDDDSLVEKNWIEAHLKCIDFFNADISSGVSISKIGDKIPFHYSYFRYSDQIDTGNVLLKKEIFYKIGFFDTKFEKQRMGDGEYGLRCYLNGYKNISNYKAKRIHLKVPQGGLREMGSWDGWRPKKLFGPRPVPSVLYFSRKYFGNKLSRWYILSSILPSLVPYKYKNNKFLKLISFIVVPFLLPLIVYQILKSWKISSKIINKPY